MSDNAALQTLEARLKALQDERDAFVQNALNEANLQFARAVARYDGQVLELGNTIEIVRSTLSPVSPEPPAQAPTEEIP